MREELEPLRRNWNLDQTGPGDFWVGKWAGLRLQVALSGVGRRRAQATLPQLLRHGQPDLLLSLGYSGGLKAHLGAGQVVLATSVVTPDGQSWESPPHTPHELHPGWQRGQLLCVSQVAAQADAKRQLAQNFPEALAVDMESAWLAQVATEAGLPWRALRIIIDPLDQALPLDFSQCMSEGGQTHGLKLARHILSRPQNWPKLLHFSGLANTARASLVSQASHFLEVVTPW
jgi:adenosylhomocysteine nucleosidase